TYLSFESGSAYAQATVKRVNDETGQVEPLEAQGHAYRSLFYLPDGRLGWTFVERNAKTLRTMSHIEIVTAGSGISSVVEVDGYVDRTDVNRSDAAIYCRRALPQGSFSTEPEDLLVVGPDGAQKVLRPME